MAQFRNDLKQGILNNPIPHHLEGPERTFDSIASQIHYEQVQQFLESAMPIQELIDWAEDILSEAELHQHDRGQIENQTAQLWREPSFVRLRRPSYTSVAGVMVMMPYELEMMTTFVTKNMWNELMTDSQIKIADDGNLPMTDLTWWSAVEFANAYSRKEGLPEAYRFEDIPRPNPKLFPPGKIRPSTTTDTPYWGVHHVVASKGYRLPTLQELAYARTEEARKSEWTTREIETLAGLRTDQIQPVASYSPQSLENGKIWDLISQLSAMTTDMPREGNDPDVQFVVTGWLSRKGVDAEKLKNPWASTKIHTTKSNPWLGFRLVRTLQYK